MRSHYSSPSSRARGTRRSIGKPKVTYWHVLGDNRLFIVRGKCAHESFEELRNKTPDKRFVHLRASHVREIKGSAPFASEVTLDY